MALSIAWWVWVSAGPVSSGVSVWWVLVSAWALAQGLQIEAGPASASILALSTGAWRLAPSAQSLSSASAQELRVAQELELGPVPLWVWMELLPLASVHSVRPAQACDTRGGIFPARCSGSLAPGPRSASLAPLATELPAVAPSDSWPSLSPSLPRPLFPARSPLRRALPRRWRPSAAASAPLASICGCSGVAAGVAPVLAAWAAGAFASRPLSEPPAIPGQLDVGLALWPAFGSIPACYAKVLWNICFSCGGRLS